MANQTIIALDLSSSTVTSVTLSDYYAPKASPVLTGTVNIGGATSVSLPTNTTIGSGATAVSSTQLGYLNGVTSNIQSQLSTISLSGSVTGNVILPQYAANSAGAIVFEGSSVDNHQLFLIPANPVADVYLTLPAITDTVVTKTTTDTFTNKTFDTSATGNVFRVNGAALTATTGTGSTAVLSTSPSITTPTLTGQVQATTGIQVANYLDVKRPNGNIAFNLYATNSVAQIGSAGDAASIDFIKPIVTSDITVNGNLTVNGTTTTINANSLLVDDKNIELGAVVASTISTTATIGAVSGSGTFTATITNMVSTAGLIPGQTITATPGTGNFGSGVVTVASIVSLTSITVSSTLTFTAGTVTNILGQAANDTTANGGGVTLKGTTDKTIIWDSTNSNWTSSENFNIASGKTFKINNVTLLDTNAPKSMATLMGYTSTATAGGTTVLTSASSYYQQFTGSSSQTVALPLTSTLITGWTFHIVNNSTSTIVVQTNDGASLTNSLPSGTTLMCTCVNTGGLGGSQEWEFGLTDFSTFTGTGAVTLATSPTFTTSVIGSATFSAFNTVTTSLSIGGAATTIGIGASTGTMTLANATITLSNATSLNINGASPSIVTTSTATASVFNTTALTGNLFGAATTLSIGSTSTATKTLNLFDGATISGATKTINIGTAGVSGSTTNINIGSAVSGASGTVTINNNIVEKGLTATGAVAPTIASATTIAPTTPIVFISGTTAIATITAPTPISSTGGTITLIPTGIFTTTTAGNIALASTAVVSRALTMTYDATTTKWYPSY